MKLNNKGNDIFILIFIIILYHFYIQNKLEKIFFKTYFNNNIIIKRPIQNPKKELLSNIGMPSGHTELITIIALILYYYNYIDWYLCVLLIVLVSVHRISTNKHTISQVIIGFLFGLIYCFIYIFFNLSFLSFFIIFLISILLCNFIIWK
jgi:membrane-associated phospholipid phosphatase